MRIKGISEHFVRFYKKLFVLDVFAGIITLQFTYLLPLYIDKLNTNGLLVIGVLFFIFSISFIILSADLLIKKGIINEIGKDLVLSFNEDSIVITTDGFSKAFLWEDISVIEVYDRKMFLKRKDKVKIISVISDQEKYINMMNQYSEREIKSKKKHEILQCHFAFMYNPAAIEMIKKHWNGIIR